MIEAIELYLIGGFLGAGKTTFLTRLLNDMSGRRVGVIVNEFGAISVDGAVIERDGIKMVEINNGSIFCACLKDGFVRTLKAFSEQPIDVLLIENSGLADPAGMKTILHGLEPYISRTYAYKGMICIIDSTTFLTYVDVLMPLQSQAMEADFFIVNKTDLVEKETVEEIHEMLHSFNPKAMICDTVYAEIPLPLPDFPDGEPSKQESANTPYSRPASYTLRTDGELTAEQLKEFCRIMSRYVLRIKGFTRFGEGWIHTDAVGAQISVRLSTARNLRLNKGNLVVIGRGKEDIHQVIQDAWDQACAVPCEILEPYNNKPRIFRPFENV